MAISNFEQLTEDDWNSISMDYNKITPDIQRTGENDPTITVTLYVNKTVNSAFVITLESSASESLSLSVDDSTPDEFDLVAMNASSKQGTVYYYFNESEGWTSNFDVSVSLTNTNSKKGKWTFTKGKGTDDLYR